MFRPRRTILYEKNAFSVREGNNTVDELTNDTSNGIVAQKSGFGEEKVVGVEKNIFSEEKCGFFCLQMLHEVGHALLEHDFYTTDLERLKMERAAWEKARELCQKYGVEYDEDYVEGALDSYRDWLHTRSRCVRCGATRFQDDRGEYHCLECEEFGAGN